MIHVDASFISALNTRGLGVVVRNGKEEWHSGFGKKIYANDPLAAEISDIQEKFCSVEANQIPNGIIYSDCKNAVELVL